MTFCNLVLNLELILGCLFHRGNYMTNPNKGKWYRFNDTIVEEFEMTDATLEAECFGGKYKAKVYDSCKFHHVRVNSLRHSFVF